MVEPLYELLNTLDALAHSQGDIRSDSPGWLHLAAHLATLAVYVTVPGILVHLWRLRRDMLFIESERAHEERRRTETQLYLAEERYRTLVSVMSSMVFTADARGAFVPSEPWTRYTGQRAAEQAGSGWLDMVHDDEREQVRERWLAALRQGARFEARFRLWHAASGRYGHVEAAAVALRGDSSFKGKGKGEGEGEGEGWIGTITDVEACVRAAELQRSNQDLDEFAQLAAHDLKEPLRGIQHYAACVLEDCQEMLDDAARSRLQTILRLSKRMTHQLDSLLHYSRVGRGDLAIDEVDLGATVARAIDSLQASIAEHGVEVRIPRPLPTLVCDRVRIDELFHNLISNAIKYNDKPRKWVEIGWTERRDGTMVFHVRDNGIGIDARHTEAVFRIFRRLHGRDEFGSGTGVGLTIVKKIVERHGGTIWVESAVGQGSTFFFTLQ